jgi:hypothetical protein
MISSCPDLAHRVPRLFNMRYLASHDPQSSVYERTGDQVRDVLGVSAVPHSLNVALDYAPRHAEMIANLACRPAIGQQLENRILCSFRRYNWAWQLGTA